MIQYGFVMGGHRGLVVAFVALLVVGAGCSSGAQGAPGPDVGVPSSSTSPPPSTPTAPTVSAPPDRAAMARVPKAARAHTPEGAEAFARFYLEQVNQAWMVPDPELIRPYALKSCKTCANILTTAQWLVEHQLRYQSPPSTVGVSVVLPESTKDRVFVEVVNNQEKSNIVTADGTVHRTIAHRYAGSQVELHWRNGYWTVRGIKAVL